MDTIKERCDTVWSGAGSDLRVSFLSLIRKPGFTILTVTALSLSVAMTTLIFSLVDGVLLQPLPYRDPDRLVRVFESGTRYPKFAVSAAFFLEIERESRTLESIALYTGENLQLMHENQPENLTAVRVSNEFFPTLGVQPLLGRNFEAEEMRGAPRVVILSHTLWTRRFAADPAIVGRTIRLNRQDWTVVGVLPPGFEHVGGAYRSPLQGESVDIWWPVALDLPENGMAGWHFMNAVGRLAPGARVEEARQELDSLMAELERRYPNSHQNWRAGVSWLGEEVVGNSSQTVMLLIAAGGLVLLIAAVNMAGLCVARALARRRDLAIRQALGARPWRLMRGLLLEHILLGSVSGFLGLGLAALAIPFLRILLPADFPRLHNIHLNLTVAGFALLSALITASLASLLPALKQTRSDPREALGEESRGSSAGSGSRRLRAVLVVAEIALAALLCASTALVARSASLLERRDHGFDPSGVLIFNLSLPENFYNTQPLVMNLFDELLNRWQQLPGIEAAGLSTNLPWTGYDENAGFQIVGRPDSTADGQGRYQAATPGYFQALRIRLSRGRLFDSRDRTDSHLVLLVNESLARRYFPDEDPVGKVLNAWGQEREVIGVVADLRDRPGDAEAEPAYWFPMTQQPFTAFSVAIRTTAKPLALSQAVLGELRAVDPELPAAELRAMDDIVTTALAERRFALWLFEAFATLALGLAAVGIYGLLSYLVQLRRRELGIRMALGATRGSILGMVLRDGARLCLAGLLAGLVLVPLAGRGLSSLLYGVGGSDPLSLGSAALLILLVVLAASLLPALAAIRSHPLRALRLD